MDADYSVELGPTAPALEIPWHDPEGQLHYVNLRDGSGTTERNVERNVERNTERIPEAQQFPALRRFLIDLNSPQSAWQTAKCDVWSSNTETAENLYGAGFSQCCYVDMVFAEQAAAIRGSLEVHQRLAKEIAQRLEADEALPATAEIVVRRCYFHSRKDIALEESEAGYCLTMFFTGFGESAKEAEQSWERAMELGAKCWLQSQP